MAPAAPTGNALAKYFGKLTMAQHLILAELVAQAINGQNDPSAPRGFNELHVNIKALSAVINNFLNPSVSELQTVTHKLELKRAVLKVITDQISKLEHERPAAPSSHKRHVVMESSEDAGIAEEELLARKKAKKELSPEQEQTKIKNKLHDLIGYTAKGDVPSKGHELLHPPGKAYLVPDWSLGINEGSNAEIVNQVINLVLQDHQRWCWIMAGANIWVTEKGMEDPDTFSKEIIKLIWVGKERSVVDQNGKVDKHWWKSMCASRALSNVQKKKLG
ncbi:hypothetical protein DACRYDRAFT_17692 [Dacryopinax primogenitus]|uniref:Uncharacterized protein n=1 Tax=Dacryopinax primogenitus (strain DJM 731) TaxID=1858805 RepID=M5FSU0_DACPD|nr:uncharacterized protein DACRYDRAFT_17692 [Dacryopinax primogenitus]EJT99018.1 hypothetical protein DACRYDRAFT_17692 [Dacryopinax primogenitus]